MNQYDEPIIEPILSYLYQGSTDRLFLKFSGPGTRTGPLGPGPIGVGPWIPDLYNIGHIIFNLALVLELRNIFPQNQSKSNIVFIKNNFYFILSYKCHLLIVNLQIQVSKLCFNLNTCSFT